MNLMIIYQKSEQYYSVLHRLIFSSCCSALNSFKVNLILILLNVWNLIDSNLINVKLNGLMILLFRLEVCKVSIENFKNFVFPHRCTC